MHEKSFFFQTAEETSPYRSNTLFLLDIVLAGSDFVLFPFIGWFGRALNSQVQMIAVWRHEEPTSTKIVVQCCKQVTSCSKATRLGNNKSALQLREQKIVVSVFKGYRELNYSAKGKNICNQLSQVFIQLWLCVMLLGLLVLILAYSTCEIVSITYNPPGGVNCTTARLDVFHHPINDSYIMCEEVCPPFKLTNWHWNFCKKNCQSSY
jgi:hypothetical protein